MEDIYLHNVIVRKPISLEEAKQWSQHYIQNYKRLFYKEYPEHYVFRNIPLNKFNHKSLKLTKINDVVSLVYGTLAKNNGMQNVRDQERTSPLPLTEEDGRQEREEVPL
jgi:hypothetical protein